MLSVCADQLQMLKSREVIQMCQAGKARQARAMLVDSLSRMSLKDQRFKKRLLEDLFYVELHLGSLAAGLHALEQRRALGYSKTEQRMDAALHAATLLARSASTEDWLFRYLSPYRCHIGIVSSFYIRALCLSTTLIAISPAVGWHCSDRILHDRHRAGSGPWGYASFWLTLRLLASKTGDVLGG
jgi:hypothetical protein